MNKDIRTLFPMKDEEPEFGPPAPVPGTLHVVIYTDGVDTHIQSVHLTKDSAIDEAKEQRQRMQQYRDSYFIRGRRAAAYLVLDAPVVHVERV